MSGRNIRNFIFSAHKWVGLHIALYFGLMFFSGVILMFADEIESITTPEIWAAQPDAGTAASFGTIYDSLAAEFDGGWVYVIQRQPRPGLADKSRVKDGQGNGLIAWSEPDTGAFIRAGSTRNFASIVREFHDSLMVPKRVGFLFVTSTSIILLILVVSGLITYRKFWRGFFRFPKRTGRGTGDARAFWGAMHRIVAIWTAPFLVILAVTTFVFFLGGLGFKGDIGKAPPPQERATALPPGFDGALIDRAEQIVLAQYPDFIVNTVVAPGHKSQPLRFDGELGGYTLMGHTAISVDPVSLEILGITGPTDRRGLARVTPLANALHYGEWGGTISRVLWVLLGMLCSFLAFGGARIYLARTADTEIGGAWGRYWRGMSILRWLYLVAFLATVTFLVT